MRILYVKEENCTAHKTSEAVLIRKKGYKISTYPLNNISCIVLYGNSRVTAPLLDYTFNNGIDIAYISRTGRLRGYISSVKTSNIILRMAQYDKWKDESFRMKISKKLIKNKIENQLDILFNYSKSIDDKSIKKNIGQLKINKININKANNLETIRGIEGICSKYYFSCFSKIVKNQRFSVRDRRPANDPFNATLNLTYALLENEIFSRLKGYGFDVELGYLHGIRYGRKSLVYDVMEEFRPLFADSLVIRLFNIKILKENDFERSEEGGMELKRESFNKYISYYHEKLNSEIKSISINKLFDKRIRNLKSIILKDKEY